MTNSGSSLCKSEPSPSSARLSLSISAANRLLHKLVLGCSSSEDLSVNVGWIPEQQLWIGMWNPSLACPAGQVQFHQNWMKLSLFIKKNFHQKPLSSKTTFIQTTFIQNHFHQTTTFIKKPLSSKNHSHQKTTLIKNQFQKSWTPNTSTPQHLNTSTPKHLNTSTPKRLNPKHLNTRLLTFNRPSCGTSSAFGRRCST